MLLGVVVVPVTPVWWWFVTRAKMVALRVRYPCTLSGLPALLFHLLPADIAANATACVSLFWEQSIFPSGIHWADVTP